ncbi:MAG: NPCBM/NEW2 domain-containing protein, partial [Planctomycetota bacterium]
QVPFEADTPMSVMLKHINEQLPNPQDLNEDLPDGVVHLIQRMMAKDPADRYADCGELIADLELVLEGKMPSSKAVNADKSSVAGRMKPRRPGAPKAGPGAIRRRAGGGLPLASARPKGWDDATLTMAGKKKPVERALGTDDPTLAEAGKNKPLKGPLGSDDPTLAEAGKKKPRWILRAHRPFKGTMARRKKPVYIAAAVAAVGALLLTLGLLATWKGNGTAKPEVPGTKSEGTPKSERALAKADAGAAAVVAKPEAGNPNPEKGGDQLEIRAVQPEAGNLKPVAGAVPESVAAAATAVQPGTKGGETPAAQLLPQQPDAIGKPVCLSDLVETEVRVAFPFRKKGSTGGGRIRVNGVESPNGIFMHPPNNGQSHAAYRLDKRFDIFKAAVAVDDACGDGGNRTPLIFRVVGDGRMLWESKPVPRPKEPQECSVEIAGVEKLELIVDCPGSNQSAHAVWVEPRLGSLAATKLEYENTLADVYALLNQSDVQAALTRLEEAKGDPKLAALKAALDRDIECAHWVEDLAKATAAGAGLLADKRAFTLKKSDGKEMPVGQGTRNTVTGVKDDALLIEQDLPGGKGTATWKLSDLAPQTRYALARLGLPPGGESELKLAFAGLLMLHAGGSEMTVDKVRNRLDAARKGNAPAEIMEHVQQRFNTADVELPALKSWAATSEAQL